MTPHDNAAAGDSASAGRSPSGHDAGRETPAPPAGLSPGAAVAKTAADAPEMAEEALRLTAEIRKDQFGTMDDVAFGSAEATLSDIAALPPAPLPADVAFDLSAFREIVRLWGVMKKQRGYMVLPKFEEAMDAAWENAETVRLAALHKPAPLTEAQQEEEAKRRG